MNKKIKKTQSQAVKDRRLGLLLMIPVVIVVFIIMGLPFIRAIYWSFTDKVIGAEANFIGFDNYIKLFSDKIYWKSLTNTLVYTVVCIVAKLLIGLLWAVLLNQNFKGRGFFRALVFVPWAMSGVLTAVLFSLIYNQNYGVLNDLLMNIGLIKEPVAWLGNQHIVLGSVIVAELWRGIPFFAISLLAAMQGLSQDVYEAAKVDGATKWQSFRFVTLPLLKDTIVLTTLLRTIWEFNSVDLIFSLTNGGPVGKTTTLSVLIANQALTTNNYGYGSAISVVSFVILAVIAVIYMKVSGFAKGSDS